MSFRSNSVHVTRESTSAQQQPTFRPRSCFTPYLLFKRRPRDDGTSQDVNLQLEPIRRTNTDGEVIGFDIVGPVKGSGQTRRVKAHTVINAGRFNIQRIEMYVPVPAVTTTGGGMGKVIDAAMLRLITIFLSHFIENMFSNMSINSESG